MSLLQPTRSLLGLKASGALLLPSTDLVFANLVRKTHGPSSSFGLPAGSTPRASSTGVASVGLPNRIIRREIGSRSTLEGTRGHAAGANLSPADNRCTQMQEDAFCNDLSLLLHRREVTKRLGESDPWTSSPTDRNLPVVVIIIPRISIQMGALSDAISSRKCLKLSLAGLYALTLATAAPSQQVVVSCAVANDMLSSPAAPGMKLTVLGDTKGPPATTVWRIQPMDGDKYKIRPYMLPQSAVGYALATPYPPGSELPEVRHLPRLSPPVNITSSVRYSFLKVCSGVKMEFAIERAGEGTFVVTVPGEGLALTVENTFEDAPPIRQVFLRHTHRRITQRFVFTTPQWE
ncbi:hypothetical protein FB451DRAFT_1168427 [Mycena latifolia]|nr:hypothetical protein FB451DRAFT_1168427 [Mycena latifolia]